MYLCNVHVVTCNIYHSNTEFVQESKSNQKLPYVWQPLRMSHIEIRFSDAVLEKSEFESL